MYGKRLAGWQGALAAILLSGSALAWAQGTVPVNVEVKDPSGAALANYPVAVSWQADQPFRTIISDQDGQLVIPLTPGGYDLRVGTSDYRQATVHLDVGPAMSVAVLLRPGGSANHVQVIPVPFPVVPQAVAVTAMIRDGAPAQDQGYTPVTVVVTGPDGAAVPGAEVGVTPGSPSGDHFVADEQGRVAVGLVPGEYRLRITAEGFAPVERKVVVTETAQTVNVALGAAPPENGPMDTNAAAQTPGAVPLGMAGGEDGATAPEAANLLVITAGPRQRGVFTPATLKDYPHQTVTIFDHHTKKNETYSGVPLMDLLEHLGVPHGKDLMGKMLGEYIVATGSDGYKSVVALGEVDPEFHPGKVLVADTMDGKPLGAKTGPFRLVVSEDKRPARSVRNLVSIEVRTAE
ncbi:MAG: carboxypeptidase regulatory-like domain-containing protein [Acidobacteriaceae bacterium]